MSRYRHFKPARRGDVLVLRFLETSLFNNLTVHELDEEIEDFLGRYHPHKLIIDFGPVRRCSTAVINSLLRARSRLVDNGGKLKLSGMSETIRKEFEMLSLDTTVFEIHDSESAALAAFDETPDRYRRFKLQQSGEVFVVHLLDPKLSQNLEVSELEDEIQDFVARETPKHVLLNFGAVSACSTAVINALLRLRSTLESDGGDLKLCGVNEQIAAQLEMMQLERLLAVYDSAGEALKAFR